MPQPGEEQPRVREAPIRGHARAATPAGRRSPRAFARRSPWRCLYHRAPMSVFERARPPQRPPHPHGADATGAVGLVLRDARRGLALRDGGVERHRALRRAHVLQGDGAPPDRARHLHRDRLDRRRVQRVHREGDHRLLRPLRGREPRRRARRPRRHAAQLAVRRGGDRAREGRHRRGDEHVLRHAEGLRLGRLRRPRLRRPPARLGHPRPQGDDPGSDPRHVHGLPRPLVHGEAHGDRRGRRRRAGPGREARGAPRRPARGRRRLARAGGAVAERRRG